MKKKSKIFVKVLVISLLVVAAAVTALYIMFKPAPAVSIGENAVTAKQLVTYSDDYIKEYCRNKNVYLSGIEMQIDGGQVGEVTMIYAYVRWERYHGYEVNMNAAEHMIYGIGYAEMRGIRSGRFMDFSTWKIDSNEAIEIALQGLQEKGYEIDDSKVSIEGRRDATQTDRWLITFYSDSNIEKYQGAPYVFVNAHTGEIINFTINQKRYEWSESTP